MWEVKFRLLTISIHASPFSIRPVLKAPRVTSLEPYKFRTPRLSRKSFKVFQASSWVNSKAWISPCSSSFESGRCSASSTASFNQLRKSLDKVIETLNPANVFAAHLLPHFLEWCGGAGAWLLSHGD